MSGCGRMGWVDEWVDGWVGGCGWVGVGGWGGWMDGGDGWMDGRTDGRIKVGQASASSIFTSACSSACSVVKSFSRVQCQRISAFNQSQGHVMPIEIWSKYCFAVKGLGVDLDMA